MKAHRLELLIIDFDEVGAEDIKTIIENAHYPNRCIAPEVLGIQTVDIGDFHDDHPLNNRDTQAEALAEFFPSETARLRAALEQVATCTDETGTCDCIIRCREALNPHPAP